MVTRKDTNPAAAVKPSVQKPKTPTKAKPLAVPKPLAPPPDPNAELKAASVKHGRCIEDLQRENEALRRKLAQLSKQVTDLAKLVNSPISLKIKAGIDGLTPGGPYVAIFGKLKVNGQIEDVY